MYDQSCSTVNIESLCLWAYIFIRNGHGIQNMETESGNQVGMLNYPFFVYIGNMKEWIEKVENFRSMEKKQR